MSEWVSEWVREWATESVSESVSERLSQWFSRQGDSHHAVGQLVRTWRWFYLLFHWAGKSDLVKYLWSEKLEYILQGMFLPWTTCWLFIPPHREQYWVGLLSVFVKDSLLWEWINLSEANITDWASNHPPRNNPTCGYLAYKTTVNAWLFEAKNCLGPQIYALL